MMDYVFPPAPVPSVPMSGGGRFPVRRIFCVGRNYADHAREMGSDPDREAPFFFTKPADALVAGGGDTPYPSATADLHHEIELVIAIGEPGANVAPAAASRLILAYGVGIDLTRRDLQSAAKKAGQPWDMAKGFDNSAPIGDLVAASQIGHPSDGLIELRVNGQVRQSGDIAQMIWSPAEIVAELSRFVALRPGDLIFTGTPSGVGSLQPGDSLDGRVAGVGAVRTRIV